MGTVENGFLVVKRFATLYREFVANGQDYSEAYAYPSHTRHPSQVTVQYRGLDRDPVGHLRRDTKAELHLLRLAQIGECVRDFILRRDAAEEVLRLAEEPAIGKFELIWLRLQGADYELPTGFRLLGYEPAELAGSNFSAICDTMCFPRHRFPDVEGLLFAGYFEELNSHGLFDSPELTQEFLDYYHSFAWAGRGDFVTVEVWGEA